METLQPAYEERAGPAAQPTSLREAFALLLNYYAQERMLFISGLVGIGVGLAGLLTRFIHGPIVEPEGVLQKAISFDLSLGIYVLTVTLFLPLANFSARGLRHWRGWHVGLVYISYAIENVQIGRGFDPRFSRVSSPTDQMLGGFFFLVAVAIMILFLIVTVRIFVKQRGHENPALLLATRYAFAAAMLAYGAGFWMSFAGSPMSGGANILPLHAIGFHGLQAVPLLALLLGWSNVSSDEAKRWIHFAGLAWLSACVTIALQTALGRPLLEFSPLPALTAALILTWIVLATQVAFRWLRYQPVSSR